MADPPAHDEGTGRQDAARDAPAEQRREHVRVQLLQRCVVRIAGARAQAAELIDVSGTGCGFLVREAPTVGERGRVRIDFESWTLETPIIVRDVRAPVHDRCYVGASFDQLDQREIDQIVHEVFTVMRRQIRNVRREQ